MVKAAHWSLKRILKNSMGDLCFCWDSINKMIILQHNAIKASFQKSLHVVGHRFKVTTYKAFVSKYALNRSTSTALFFYQTPHLIAEELDKN